MSDLNDLISAVLDDANKAHIEHIASPQKSLAVHMALGEFYSDVRDAVDSAGEALIALGIRMDGLDRSILDTLKEGYVKVVGMRDLCDGDPTAENIYDGIGAAYLKAIYKLENLK